jgi:preprotein translocase subunit SecG
MSKPRPEDEIVRSRQKNGARITAILLIAFVVLTFAITIAKLTVNR